MRKADNLPPSCAVVTKSGNLNFLEPSEPVQACNGTDLPFTFYFYIYVFLDSGIFVPVSKIYPGFVFEDVQFMINCPLNSK